MADSDVSPWVVIGQKEDFQTDSQGQPSAGVVVYFTTGRGHKGSVFVPNAEYSRERVRQLIRMRAATMDDIGQLTGS